jgi:pre-rRNA-processing protein TSR3
VDLHVRYEGDDDPDKCTARKLSRFDLATLHRRDRETPAGVVLNPHAERALSPALAIARWSHSIVRGSRPARSDSRCRVPTGRSPISSPRTP